MLQKRKDTKSIINMILERNPLVSLSVWIAILHLLQTLFWACVRVVLFVESQLWLYPCPGSGCPDFQVGVDRRRSRRDHRCLGAASPRQRETPGHRATPRHHGRRMGIALGITRCPGDTAPG
ncbi:hypothetical protein Q3G72_029698 [Acer saccharum]|nr:hypothetical protein Q3G72_029698 [Acer saccharum]